MVLARILRALLVVAALLAAPISVALLPVALLPVASAAPASACSTSSGVLVVVDFRHFGGSLTRGCDPSPSTGLTALHQAGYSTQGTQHDGPAFVCRIDGYPTAKQQACVTTPPANAYWSYWHADAGQSRWTYSTMGAQSYHPPVGSVDAWVFGATNVAGTSGGPSFTPADARGQRASGGGTAKPSGHSSPASSAPRGSRHATPSTPGATTSTATSTPTRTVTRSAKPSTTTTSPRASSAAPSSSAVGPAASSSGVDPVPSFADASSVAQNSSSSGSPWPLLFGVALVLLLGAGGGWGVLRRRRADAADQ